MDTAIIASMAYIGRSPSEVDVVFDSATKEGELDVLEKTVVQDGLSLLLTVTAEKNKIVRVSWLAKSHENPRVWSELYWRISSALMSRSFSPISRSTALDGQVVLGDKVTRPGTGASYWLSLLDPAEKARVDMAYVVQAMRVKDFNITASSAVAMPSPAAAPL